MSRKVIKEVRRRLYMEDKNLTHMAKDLGISYSYMLDVLHGRRKSVPVVERIAAYLNYPELVELYKEEFAVVQR
ncbi:hypothetical protein SAMN06269117_12524 [Balnearium lithotrophicum]|uniref:HTH cro/C1-type domain-containing protein n=1 Tax=Balnearium lithotrophicum TaxID=223788 RepID=A0A521DT45_9BACT|nr:helix-turn-helix transcriptional regulator [Balnearium lithotrophicum]SMO74886.1 hypothetical protein SAMN06269117_12524 [Balnearium lithotrophicum]